MPPVSSFTCPRCGAVSHNPADLIEGYCGRCRDWTAPLAPEGSFEVPGTPEWPFDVHIRYKLLRGRSEPVEVTVTGQMVDGHLAVVNGTVLRQVPLHRLMRTGLALTGLPRQNEPS